MKTLTVLRRKRGWLWRRTPAALSLIFGLALVALPCFGQPSLQDRIAGYLEGSQEAFQKREWEKAESDAREALWISLDQLGAISSALKQYDLAERAYQEASHASASGAESLLGLAILYLRVGRYHEAIESVNGLLEINPLQPSAHHVLGKIYFMQGRYPEAASSLRDSYRAKHTDPSVAYTLALTYLKLGDSAAGTVFKDMLEQLGDSPGLRILFGRAYREAGDLDGAEREFRAAIALSPQVTRAHYYLALTLLRSKGRAGFAEARKELEAELEVNPSSHFASFFLGVVYNQESEFEKSLPFLRKAVETAPDSPDGWLYLGTSLAQLGRGEEAVPALRKALELTKEPSRNNYQIANGYFVLGRLLRASGAREEAAVLLKTAAKLKAEASRNEPSILDNVLPDAHAVAGAVSLAATPETPAILDDAEPDEEAREILRNTATFCRESAARACQQLARLAIERERFSKAEGYLERSIFWDPSLSGNRFNLAVARIKNGNPAGAVGPLVEELEKDPDRREVQQLLANLALSLSDGPNPEAAERAVDALLGLNPEIPDLHLLRGNLTARRSQYGEALADYATALRKNPATPEAHYYSGLSLIRLGRFQEAVDEFEAELRLNPGHAKAMYHKAFVFLSQGRGDEAVPLLEKVVRLKPDYGEAYYELGKAQLERKELLIGLANLETSAHLSPAAPHVFYQLYRGYQMSGRTQEAEVAFQRYRELKKAQEEANLAHRKEGAAQPPD